MITKHFLAATLAMGAAFLIGPGANAQWLTHTAVGPAGTGTTATFANGIGAYSGVVTTTANILNGTLGIVPGAITNVTPSFLTHCTLDVPGNSFDYLGVTYNGLSGNYTVTFNFTGLQMGYLPAGSVISLLDVDLGENLTYLKAFDASVTHILTPWLSSTGTPFDYNNVMGDNINQSIVSTVNFYGGSLGIYSVSGDPQNQDSAFQGFTTNQNISKISFKFTTNGTSGGPGGYGFAVGDPLAIVPEPTSEVLSLMGVFVGLLFWRLKPAFRKKVV